MAELCELCGWPDYFKHHPSCERYTRPPRPFRYSERLNRKLQDVMNAPDLETMKNIMVEALEIAKESNRG